MTIDYTTLFPIFWSTVSFLVKQVEQKHSSLKNFPFILKFHFSAFFTNKSSTRTPPNLFQRPSI